MFKKVKENETITVNKYEDSTVYFLVVKQYFEECYEQKEVRLEALGSAVANLIAVSNLLSCSGVAMIKKTKSRE